MAPQTEDQDIIETLHQETEEEAPETLPHQELGGQGCMSREEQDPIGWIVTGLTCTQG